MRTKFNFKVQITNLLIVGFVLIASSGLIAQEKKSNDLKNFKIIIEKTDDGIKMTCDEGSAWNELSFPTKKDRPQAVDQFGMTRVDKISTQKDPKIADYLFTITKTENGIVLKGIKGTAWTDLSFSLSKNEKQAIDQFGMTTLK